MTAALLTFLVRAGCLVALVACAVYLAREALWCHRRGMARVHGYGRSWQPRHTCDRQQLVIRDGVVCGCAVGAA